MHTIQMQMKGAGAPRYRPMSLLPWDYETEEAKTTACHCANPLCLSPSLAAGLNEQNMDSLKKHEQAFGKAY